MRFARAILFRRWFIGLVIAFAVVEFYNLAVLPGLVQMQQGRLKRAEAGNADEFREAERQDTEAKAIGAFEITRYAKHTQAALGRLKAAQADIASSKAEIDAQDAKNAKLKAFADAKQQEAQDELNRAQLASEKQITFQAARLQAAQTCSRMLDSAFHQAIIIVPPGELYDAMSGLASDMADQPRPTVFGDTSKNPCGNEPEPPPLTDPPTVAQSGQPLAKSDSAPQTAALQQSASSASALAKAIVIDTDLNVRSAPNGEIRNKLAKGQLVEIIKKLDNGWVAVGGVCEDQTACTGAVKDGPPYLVNAMAKVVSIELNVRDRPDPGNSAIVGKLHQGQTLEVSHMEANGWLAITATCIDGKSCSGYVNGRSEFVTPLDQD